MLNYESSILHVDADAFFVSCEIASRPELKNKSVVVGQERGIVSALSYSAKAKGIRRGMRVKQVKEICKDTIFLSSDYEKYNLYSLRMNEIIKRFSFQIEEYSIDECFTDLKGLRNYFKMSYEDIARKIKENLELELGFSFSLGLGPNKLLAKIASNWQKPAGLTNIEKQNIDYYLKSLDIIDVWGIGPQTSAYLNKFKIFSALDLKNKQEYFIRNRFNKNIYEIWQELRGESVFKLNFERKNKSKSISKTKTFNPSSSSSSYIFSHLSKNTEEACFKLRQYDLATKKIIFFIKDVNLKCYAYEFKLKNKTNNPKEILKMIDKYFNLVFLKNKKYRATGVVLDNLLSNNLKQADLFGQYIEAEKISKIFVSFDKLNQKYGKNSLFLASSLKAIETKKNLNKNFKIPFLGEVC